jgi:hypothetical protein
MTMKTSRLILSALVALALPAAASAQSQFQGTFELGIGYTRPAVERFDMVTGLLQAQEYFIESGIGFRTNSGFGDETVFSWLVRAAARPFVIGNTTGHIGGEFSLHTNSAIDDGEPGTLLGLGLLIGASHPITDHLNFGVHLFPIAFEFGNEEGVFKFGVAELSAHILF